MVRILNTVLPVIMLAMLLSSREGYSQQFGRNNPNYGKFDFKVRSTPHFELYHYLKNDSLVETFGSASERWYRAHQKVFRDTFETRNPIILYANHPDFWQTNAILGSVGIGM